MTQLPAPAPCCRWTPSTAIWKPALKNRIFVPRERERPSTQSSCAMCIVLFMSLVSPSGVARLRDVSNQGKREITASAFATSISQLSLRAQALALRELTPKNGGLQNLQYRAGLGWYKPPGKRKERNLFRVPCRLPRGMLLPAGAIRTAGRSGGVRRGPPPLHHRAINTFWRSIFG